MSVIPTKHIASCGDCFSSSCICLFWQPTLCISASSNVSFPFSFRLIGSAKIPLRDLASGPAKSLPSRNVPLMNEKQQAVGVGKALHHTDFFYIYLLNCTFTKRVDTYA